MTGWLTGRRNGLGGAALLAAALFVVAVPRSSAAEPEAKPAVAEAKALDKQAREAFEAKRFEEAARAWAAGAELLPRGATKYNEAFAWQKAGQIAAAADAYEAALELGVPDDLEKPSSERLAKLKGELGYLVVTGPEGGRISIAHAKDRPVPAKIHLPIGHHTATLVADDGRSAQVEVDSAAGVSTILKTPPELAPITPDPVPQPMPIPPEEEPGGGWMTPVGWTFVGLAGAATGATIALGVLTLNTVDDYDAGGNTDDDLRRKALTLRTTTNVMIGVSSALAVGGVLLLLLAPSEPDDTESEEASLDLSIAPTGGSITVRW
ncbi:MAG: hypothetical protein R3B72_18990 [Polyangiaceae bacterium]